MMEPLYRLEAPIASGEASTTLPLFEVVDAPDMKDTEPPDAAEAVLYPPITFTAPPAAADEVPARTNTEPPTPELPEPTVK